MIIFEGLKFWLCCLLWRRLSVEGKKQNPIGPQFISPACISLLPLPPMASADDTESYEYALHWQQCLQWSDLFLLLSFSLSFLSFQCSVICFPSSQIILSALVLTCHTAVHVGPISAPSIYHPFTSLHNFLSVTERPVAHLFIDFWFSVCEWLFSMGWVVQVPFRCY